MSFSSLRTVSYRNLSDGEVALGAREIYLVGENGQGKSNFLESLYVCSYGTSFRGVRDGELVRTGSREASVGAALSGGLHDKVLVKIEPQKKSVSVDGKRVEDRKELLSVAPSVVFCHEDMEFVAGTPERRRWFFDQSQSLHDPAYIEDLRRYRRILKVRNTLIKDRRPDMLDVVDPQIASYGLALMEKRRAAAKRFSETFGPLYEEVAGIAGIGVSYLPSWKDESETAIAESLMRRRETDMAMGTSLSGPHRDRYVFARRSIDFAAKASTGQRRLLALLLRVAQARRYYEATGGNPVLLLDDVLLELDPEKRRRFLSVLPDYDQAFFTFLPEEPYERYRKSDTLVYRVIEGRIAP